MRWTLRSRCRSAIGSRTEHASDAAHKQIGVPSNAKSETIPSLIVLNAGGANLQGSTLTLLGAASNAVVFADRPVRAAGHALTTDLLQEWSSGSESFGKDPPNATVSVLSKDASFVVLTAPKLD